MTTKEQAYKTLKKLIERFDDHIDEYKKGSYNETQTRIDYINPFFKALGWDIDNKQGLPEAYREVVHEAKVKVKGATKAPDYGFRLSDGKFLFFLEAKKPSVNIKGDIAPAYQVRRYGWSAKLPIAIVTDFEEFSIYDCSKMPKQNDKSSVSRIQYLTYKDYLKEFDFLWETFSKEQILKGSFDKFVQSGTKKRGTATVDDEFLKEIEQWRTYLATTIALRNKTLSEDEINYAVQKIIDRIIFLRICEDRGVEQYGNLKNTIKQGDLYKNLFELFRIADDKYNSGLFDFKEDKITPGLTIDSKVIKNIVQELYYPLSPFEFSVLPADILGHVYEQFLGKTIRLTKAHHAKIEEKPEVRKAGGVYYTPKYIVDYIVENTVGKLLEGKTPKQIEKIKICDPACGSGSFLIGAYQYLLDWHLKYYTNLLKKTGKSPLKGGRLPKAIRGVLTPDGHLTTTEKKRILLNNIYGVDIDTQAVEVTKLNLLLKAMEGETQASIGHTLSMFHERVLPNLKDNIKCGNSLIGNDYYDSSQIDLFAEQNKKIKAFDWKEEFTEIFEKGGFDIVIGNPPYGATLTADEIKYLKNNYTSASYQLDTYSLFIVKAFKISISNGVVGFIIPSAWVASVYDIKLRKFLAEKTNIRTIVITPKQTFKDASVETLMLIYSKQKKELKDLFVERWDSDEKIKYKIPINNVNSDTNYIFPVYSDPKKLEIIRKIKRQTNRLEDFADFVWGVKIYQKGKGKPPQNGIESKEKFFHSERKTKNTHKPLLGGKEIRRYSLNWNGMFVDYGEWLAEPRTEDWFTNKRILLREVTAKGVIQAVLVNEDYVFSNSVDGIRVTNEKIKSEYILGLLNSRLMSFYHFNTSPNAFKGTFPKLLIKDLRELPIPSANDNKSNQIVKHVDNLLKLNKQLQATKLETQRQQIQRTIDHSEKKIDELVYGLYGLRKEEIEIIEKTL